MNSRRFLVAAASVACAASLTSCFDQQQTFTVNPDGSGKYTAVVTVNPQGLGGLGAAPPTDPGKQIMLQMIRGAEGIQVWSEAKTETTSDGKVKVTMTGYYPDVNKVKLQAGMGGGGTKGPKANALVSKNEGGTWRLELGLPEGASSATGSSGASATPPSSEAIKQAQTQWQSSKALVGPLLADAKVVTVINAGGSITETLGFSKDSDSSATLTMTGSKLIDSVDKTIMDDKLAGEMLAGGDLTSGLRDQKRLQKLVMDAVTDGKGMPQVTLKPGSPAFDYKAEVAKAEAGQSSELKALLEEAKKPGGAVIRPPRPGGPAGGGKVAPPTRKAVE